MAITINLPPEQEQAVRAHAEAEGLSVDKWLANLLLANTSEKQPRPMKHANLSDLLLNSPFAGSNLNLDRVQDLPRHVEIE